MCRTQQWSKGKVKEKSNMAVLFDKATFEKLQSEVPKYKMITPSILVDRLRVRPPGPCRVRRPGGGRRREGRAASRARARSRRR